MVVFVSSYTAKPTHLLAHGMVAEGCEKPNLACMHSQFRAYKTLSSYTIFSSLIQHSYSTNTSIPMKLSVSTALAVLAFFGTTNATPVVSSDAVGYYEVPNAIPEGIPTNVSLSHASYTHICIVRVEPTSYYPM